MTTYAWHPAIGSSDNGSGAFQAVRNELEAVLADSQRDTVQRLTMVFADRLESERRRLRQREAGPRYHMPGDMEAGAWTRGFFDRKVESSREYGMAPLPIRSRAGKESQAPHGEDADRMPRTTQKSAVVEIDHDAVVQHAIAMKAVVQEVRTPMAAQPRPTQLLKTVDPQWIISKARNLRSVFDDLAVHEPKVLEPGADRPHASVSSRPAAMSGAPFRTVQADRSRDDRLRLQALYAMGAGSDEVARNPPSGGRTPPRGVPGIGISLGGARTPPSGTLTPPPGGARTPPLGTGSPAGETLRTFHGRDAAAPKRTENAELGRTLGEIVSQLESAKIIGPRAGPGAAGLACENSSGSAPLGAGASA